MGDKEKTVLVVDKDGKYLDLTRPAKARRLIDEAKAFWVRKNPPIIQLKKRVRRVKMNIRKINEYFRSNDDVYIQNISGGVVSLAFYHPDGRIEPFTLPNDRRPICLTNWIPKDLIEKSPDFRRLIMRRPPAIRLLTEEEYYNLINRVAKEVGKTPEEVEDEVAQRMTKARDKSDFAVPQEETIEMKVEETPEEGSPEIDVPGFVENEVNPRVMQIVANCSENAENRIKASDAIQELSLLNLSLEDLNYIIGNCSYKTVRSWSQKKLGELEKSPLEIEE